MKFQLIDGKMKPIQEVSKEVITWSFPTEPTVKNRRGMEDIPFATLNYQPKTFNVRSSLIAGLGTVTLAAANPTNGIFWNTFMTYLFPWFLDIAQVFCAIKIAQAFYQENRGGRDSGSGMESMVTYGKWLLLFHMIPFAVKLIDQLGKTMANSVGN